MKIVGHPVPKKTDHHAAVVTGDTVGDPFKDTSGPALNILIKLMSVLSLTCAGIFKDDWSTWWSGVIVLVVELILCAIAYYYVWHTDKTMDVLSEAQAEAAAKENGEVVEMQQNTASKGPPSPKGAPPATGNNSG